VNTRALRKGAKSSRKACGVNGLFTAVSAIG
jgi:hypothetical protein